MQFYGRATPNFRTLSQKQHVRLVLSARSRWKRVGFHSVSHRLVERRSGVGLVRFGLSAGAVQQQEMRRKFRDWKPMGRSVSVKVEPKTQNKVGVRVAASRAKTLQWRRARTAHLMLERDRKKQLGELTEAKTNKLRPLPAHEMKRQRGRDLVRCLTKHRQTVVRFGNAVRKETKRANEPIVPQSQSESERRGRSPFATALGRGGAPVDVATGLFLLGRAEDASMVNALRLEPNDVGVRPRERAVMITYPRGGRCDDRCPVDTNVATALAYSPRYELVDRSVHGHRFVRFETQLARPRGQDIKSEELVLAPDLAAVRDRVQFPRGSTQPVDYAKMIGRDWLRR